MKKYKLTDKHREELKPWADKWINIILDCTSMTDDDKQISRDAVKSLYQSARLEALPDKRIVFVKSPIQGAFVAAIANYIWWLSDNKAATRDATADAILDAARDAARDATWDDTMAATWDATINTLGTWYITNPAYIRLINSIKKIHKNNNLDIFLNNVTYLYNGGNIWGQYVSFLTFFRHIAKLDIDYSKFDAYEKLSIHSGVRFMHKKFCIICDKPKYIKQDEQSRPHCDTGPFCEWRDGSKLYSVHGVRVPAWIIEHSDLITADKIINEENAEVRRIMIDKFGMENYLKASNAELLHKDKFGELYIKKETNDEDIYFVKVVNSTPEPDGSYKSYILCVPPDMKTAHQAVAWTFNRTPETYNPEIET